MVTSFFYIWTSQLQSSKKVHAIPMAIPSCLFVSFPPSQPHHLPTFPKFPTSSLSDLTQLPHFTNLPHPTFWSSPPSYLSHLPKLTTLPSTIKALQNNSIRPSLSTLVFKRRFAISELKSKILILPSQETISDHWIWALIC